jgi:hypothetical protein
VARRGSEGEWGATGGLWWRLLGARCAGSELCQGRLRVFMHCRWFTGSTEICSSVTVVVQEVRNAHDIYLLNFRWQSHGNRRPSSTLSTGIQ